MNITFCSMYTKHRKIFTSIKTSKYCTDKIAKTLKGKKDPLVWGTVESHGISMIKATHLFRYL